MNKKLLICGSTIAVVILVLASLSPVIGFYTVKPSVKDSPLFDVRTKRATQGKSEELMCSYTGKGNIFSIPKRNSQIATITKVIDTIGKMDDKTYNKVIDLVVNRIRQDTTLTDKDTDEIILILHQLRSKPKELKRYILNGEDKALTGDYFCTVFNISPLGISCAMLLYLLSLGFVLALYIYSGPTVNDGEWQPGCYLLTPFFLILASIIVFIIAWGEITSHPCTP